MPKDRRTPVTSPAGVALVLARARDSIEPPDHLPLDDAERVHFDAVVREFASSEITDHIAELAALLAQQMRSLALHSAALRQEEGALPIPAPSNPRLKTVLDLSRSVAMLRRSLQIHGRAKNGEAGVVADRRAHARAIEAAAGVGQDPAEGDDLLARKH